MKNLETHTFQKNPFIKDLLFVISNIYFFITRIFYWNQFDFSNKLHTIFCCVYSFSLPDCFVKHTQRIGITTCWQVLNKSIVIVLIFFSDIVFVTSFDVFRVTVVRIILFKIVCYIFSINLFIFLNVSERKHGKYQNLQVSLTDLNPMFYFKNVQIHH